MCLFNFCTARCIASIVPKQTNGHNMDLCFKLAEDWFKLSSNKIANLIILI